MSHEPPRVVIGSFRSTLAQAEAQWVGRELRRVRPHLRIEHATFARPAGRGAPLKEMDQALAQGTIDVAVHSARLLSLEPVPGTALAAVPTRELPFDVLVAPEGSGFEELKVGARVGASGAHRRAQLLAQRSDLTVVDVPLEPEECLARFDGGELGALVLPGADLAPRTRRPRVGDPHVEPLPPDRG